MTHIAEQLKKLVADYGRKYPDIWKLADDLVDLNKDRIFWPDYCFLPLSGWMNMIGVVPEIVDIGKLKEAGDLSTLGSWRLTQGIYEFDPYLTESLFQMDFDGNLPCEVLFQLPAWCIFIKMPLSDNVGFFVHLDYCLTNKLPELRLALFVDGKIKQTFPLLLGDWSIDEAFERLRNSSLERAMELGYLFDECDESFFNDDMKKFIIQQLNLVLYLCSANADIKGEGPLKARQTKTKKGLRYFPADKPSKWEVGYRVGSALRQASEKTADPMEHESQGIRNRPRPHIRKAHWHKFLAGPRDKERMQLIKWMPPIAVNIEFGDIIPTVHKVMQ